MRSLFTKTRVTWLKTVALTFTTWDMPISGCLCSGRKCILK